MLSADTRVRAIHVYSELNEQIDFVIMVSEEEDIQMLKHIVNDACEEWIGLKEKDCLQQITVYRFVSDTLETAGIKFQLFHKNK